MLCWSNEKLDYFTEILTEKINTSECLKEAQLGVPRGHYGTITITAYQGGVS